MSMRISYLVAVKDKARTIERCLNSLLENRADDVVVIDGRSKDGTSEIIDRYLVQHLYDEGTGNPATARNVGLKACCGDYVVIIDGDQWIPDGFNDVLKRILSEGYDAVFCREVRVGPSMWARAHQAEWTEVATLSYDSVYWPRVLKRSLIFKVGGWDDRMLSDEDFDLWNRVKKLDPKICRSSLVIYHDASDISPFTEFRRGTEMASSRVRYVRRHPSEWKRLLGAFPVGLVTGCIVMTKVFLRTRNPRIASLVLILRTARSIGHAIGLFYHPTRRLASKHRRL